jgi:hypothetical protein
MVREPKIKMHPVTGKNRERGIDARYMPNHPEGIPRQGPEVGGQVRIG